MGVHSEIDIVQNDKMSKWADSEPKSPRGTVWYEEAWRILCNNGYKRGEAKLLAVELVKKHGANAPHYAAYSRKEDMEDGSED